MTFWAAMIKGVALLARHDEQGRFFGILDGGRGLVEAILASIAVAWFAYSLDSSGGDTPAALVRVIYMYVAFALVLSPMVLFLIKEVPAEDDSGMQQPAQAETSQATEPHNYWQDIRTMLTTEELWLAGACILCAYQLFWATYSFSGYLQTQFGMTAVAVGTITVAKLWMRPIGAIGAGFIGDRFNVEKTLGWLMLGATLSLACMIVVPAGAGSVLMLGIVLLVGLLTYAVRGIYWATLDSCGIPTRIKGLAIGVISLVGYSPDIYLPLINGPILEAWPGRMGYAIYFGGIVVMGFIGCAAAMRLYRLSSRRFEREAPDA